MFIRKLLPILRTTRRIHSKVSVIRSRYFAPVTLGLLTTTAFCEDSDLQEGSLEHEFLIRQATTVNVNAATQLLTVTLVAIQDTSERLRETLSKEICLVQQAMEWGDGTPSQHWDQLVAVRGTLSDLKHNLRTLFSYMDYVEKVATAAAEISYLSGNVAASDAICERIHHATRTCNTQKQLNQALQQESLEIQQKAIISSPQLEEKLKNNESCDKTCNKK
ncbi:unnamed protein product [Parnassius apollo]|uniref:(apollo) hypothetical protein n=1 Tax=Parnassius apollo TaxID=110799 RepID=A0A8S3WKV2_PARAO|nr:unnamed protein product [Parnassius apollo]